MGAGCAGAEAGAAACDGRGHGERGSVDPRRRRRCLTADRCACNVQRLVHGHAARPVDGPARSEAGRGSADGHVRDCQAVTGRGSDLGLRRREEFRFGLTPVGLRISLAAAAGLGDLVGAGADVIGGNLAAACVYVRCAGCKPDDVGRWRLAGSGGRGRLGRGRGAVRLVLIGLALKRHGGLVSCCGRGCPVNGRRCSGNSAGATRTDQSGEVGRTIRPMLNAV
jgi:hypothetical protein